MHLDSLYLIDPGVDAIDILRTALPADVLQQTLQPGDDLLGQILLHLPEQGVSSLHLFSHAAPACLQAVAGTLALDTLAAQAARLAAIGERLGVEGEILLYGCNLAAGTQGQTFVAQLARLTGCRVAASSLPLGMTDAGPHWQLDQCSAPVRSHVLQCNSYPATLATLTGTSAAEKLLGSSSDDNLSGLEGDDSLYGYAGNDTLQGGLGSNLLYGGIGNDLLICDLGNDSLYGEDGDDTLDGGDGTDYLDGGSGNDRLDGWFGDDSLRGGTGADSLFGYFGNDTLRGDDGNDQLSGEEGDDYLDGGNGDDTLRGGVGSDTYVINSSGDLIEEFADTGSDDRVIATISYSLGQYIERLTLSGSDSLSGTGNSLNNQITGNSAANTLDGGSGADTLTGGAGNDTYRVDNSGDVVTETGDDSNDSVISTISYTLSAQVENLTLSGNAAINGTGNELNNRMAGNSAANRLGGGDGNDTLDGAGGGDTLNGGNGNDVYYIDSINDVVVESSTIGGTDTLISSVTRTLGTNLENLTLIGTLALGGIGNASANRLIGNGVANSLNGSAGNDTLTGGAGRDVLTGGSGSDFFDFNASSETGITSSTRDVIADFVSGTDRIDLSGIDANTASSGDQAFSVLLASSTAFSAAGQLRLSGSVLYGNTDTDTAAEFTIALSGITRLSLTDFIL